MFDWLKTYAIVILSTIASMLLVLLLLTLWYAKTLRSDIQSAKEQLAIVGNYSEQQKVKTVEVEKKVKEIQYKTQTKVQYVTTFIYDQNKSDCDNAMDVLRSTF